MYLPRSYLPNEKTHPDTLKGVVYYSYATIGGRLIDVQRAEVLWIANHTGKVRIEDRREEEGKVVPQVSRIVANAFPTR